MRPVQASCGPLQHSVILNGTVWHPHDYHFTAFFAINLKRETPSLPIEAISANNPRGQARGKVASQPSPPSSESKDG